MKRVYNMLNWSQNTEKFISEDLCICQIMVVIKITEIFVEEKFLHTSCNSSQVGFLPPQPFQDAFGNSKDKKSK